MNQRSHDMSDGNSSTRLSKADTMQLSNHLKTLWNRFRRCDTLISTLHAHFAQVNNPYEATLVLLKNSVDHYQSKQSCLSYTVIKEFSVWIRANEAAYIHLLDDDMKFEAFKTVNKHKNKSIYKLTIVSYKLMDDPSVFLESIRVLCDACQFKEACEWAGLLSLQDHFGLTEFLLPLTLQDKVNVVEDFLAVSPKHQLEYLKYFDDLLFNKQLDVEIQKLVGDLNVPDVHPGTLTKLNQPKSLSKLIKRLAAMFKVPESQLPNFTLRQHISTIGYIVHKRYTEGSISKEAFREMLLDAFSSKIPVHESVSEEIIKRLNQAGDPKEALHWAKQFNVPFDMLPQDVKILYDEDYCSSEEEGSAEKRSGIEGEENWAAKLVSESSKYFHVLSLPADSVVLIDSEATFAAFLDTMAVLTPSMVGLDTEWKPTFSSRSSELALIQISTDSKIYLLDVIALASFKSIWNELSLTLFANQDVLKLGFSLKGDLDLLADMLGFSVESLSSNNYLDLASLWARLVNEYKFIFPFANSSDTPGNSLAKLVELCVGRPLDKSDRYSNWQLRPLKKSQIMYAALDAYCLLEAFDVMKNAAEEQEIPFEEIVRQLLSSMGKKKKITRRRAEDDGLVRPKRGPIGVSDIKFICDAMLGGLAKQIRRCGVDTTFVGPHQAAQRCIEISHAESRVILTAGVGVKKFVKAVPPGFIYKVSARNSEEQAIEVLKWFNVVVRQEDIFSRCQQCNGDCVIKIPQSTMSTWVPSRPKLTAVPAGYEDDDLDDDFDDDYYDDYSTNHKEAPKASSIKATTSKGALVCVGDITAEVLSQTSTFFLCEDCGQVYWEGTYFDKVLGVLSNTAR